MATNLAGGGQCLGQHSACLIRAALLDTDCTPQGGTNSGIVNIGIIDATATPEYRDERRIEPTNGCGEVMFTYYQAGCLLRETLSGNIIFQDWEMMQLIFGGSLILGRTGTGFPGKVIGWAKQACPTPVQRNVYLEIITRLTSQTQGDCQTGGTAAPTYQGHIFPKVFLNCGAETFNDQQSPLPFEGFSVGNPSLVRGPWNDYPGTGAMPNSPHLRVGYSDTEDAAILATAGCGLKDLPITYS
jgi:hypothetical protein